MGINAAMASGAWAAAQMAGPFEWQQAAARTQSCCDLADCVGRCEVTARHSIPQVALASGASTSSRISARASCARRSIAIQFSPRLIRVHANHSVPPSSRQAPNCSVRQVTVAVKQLDRGEEDQPQPDQRGEDTEDEDGGAALVRMTPRCFPRIETRMGDPAKSDARAERGHEQERDADDDAGV